MSRLLWYMRHLLVTRVILACDYERHNRIVLRACQVIELNIWRGARWFEARGM